MGPSGPHTLHATFLEASRRLIPDDRAGGAITRAHARDWSPSRAVLGRDLSARDRWDVKIVMHCVYYPPEVGGLESHVHFLCRALVERGHRVDIVTSRSMPNTPPHEIRDGVHVWRTWFPGKSGPGWVAHAGGSIPRALRVSAGCDILHAQAFQSIPPLQVVRAVRRVPLVATLHTSHFLRLAAQRPWRAGLGRLVRSVDAALASSREIASVAESLAPGTSVEPITNGVDTSVFHRVRPELEPAPEGRARLVVPRRLFAKNGVEHLIRAMPRIITEVDAEAVLIGDGPDRARLEGLATELGLADRVHFLGARAHEEMPGLLSSGDLAVIPSLMEATSVAALECMACEVPVAASNVGGLPEIVDDQVGDLFEPADPEDLARVVTVLLRRNDLRDLGAHARGRVVERWSNRRLVDRHLEVYRELIQRRAAA